MIKLSSLRIQKVIICFLAILFFQPLSNASLHAQTVDEILANYFENIGGEEAVSAISSMKISGVGKAQGMEIPIKMYQKSPNMQRMDMLFQGTEITQMCYNGTTGWSTNFMTQEAELWETEDSENMAKEFDFPDAFLDYKEKGYSVSLEGEENVDGTDCFKLKLTRLPLSIDGAKVENISYHYFDKENMVPIMQEDFVHKGPMKGMTTQTFFSDYQEVSGVYHPFSIAQKADGQLMFDMVIDSCEVNVEIDESLFAAPEISADEESPIEEAMPVEEPMPAKDGKPAMKEGKDIMKKEVEQKVKSSGGDPGKGQ